ncbi:TonB-dependent receptor [Alteromonas sp. 5E99-2]|uniref:TonB-dependent receptor family protein n=1 Tax=Alteromonas sp. 5E99-2 TaxID=2817683 RepID=UPI001A996918|nr:TonB-dependent receptor [Alteromonas sp. 5E99-2]MBO1254392.1 TonB-dependent receptor [Alteromonas sp. 5E99-2]
MTIKTHTLLCASVRRAYRFSTCIQTSLTLGLSSAFLLFSASTAAEEESSLNDSVARIERITVLGDTNTEGATLGGIDLKKLPLNSFVVGRSELERIRFVDPNEFLDRIPGETQVRNLRIPDGGKGYTVPLVDGIPLENPYEGATQRLDRTNTFDIERVEVIKGPTSALFANNAFGGVINVVTRDAPKETETLVSLEAGDFNRLRARFSTAGTANSVGYFFDVNTRHLDGLRELVKDDRKQTSGKLIFNLNDYAKITARAEYLEEDENERGDLTAQELREDPTQAGSLSSSTDLEQTTFSLSYDHLMESGELNTTLVRREKDTIGASRFSGPQDENDLSYNVRVQYRHDFNTANIIGGYELYDGEQDVRQFGRNDFDLEGDFDTFLNELQINAYFVQVQNEFADGFEVTAGLRHEDIERSNTDFDEDARFSDTSIKFGITYEVSSNILVWGSISEGFYAPDLDDLFIDAQLRNFLGLDATTNLLEPEEALNIEFGLRGSVGAWRFDTSAYHNKIDNYLVTQEFFGFDESFGGEFEYELTTNAGGVTVKGIESVVEYAPQGLPVSFGVTHTYTRNKYDSFVQSTPGADDDLSGNILRRSPDHHVNARIAWQPVDALSIELEADYYSDYFADDENSAESRFTRGERLNLRVNYYLDNWRIWAHLLNFTDTQEDRATFSNGEFTFRTIEGRTLYAGASYSF